MNEALFSESMRSAESREVPAYSITIAVHRHGPKEGATGALSVEGKERSDEYFENAYEGVAPDVAEGVDVVYSPVFRARQSAEASMRAMRARGEMVRSAAVEPRLDQGLVMKFADSLPEGSGRKGGWIAPWMALDARPDVGVDERGEPIVVKTGKEAAADFAEWLEEKMSSRKDTGGAEEIEAFTHGPVMVAFLYELEALTGQSILPDNWMELSPMRTHLDFLTSFVVSSTSKDSEHFTVTFHGKSVTAPMTVLGIMKENVRALREAA